tara:strand:+ start:249 stop:515 length:267 start_codon:yes stop_codon:yes gene_type:complete
MSATNLIIANIGICIGVLIITHIIKSICNGLNMPPILFWWNTTVTALSIMAIATIIIQYNSILKRRGPPGPRGPPGINGDQGAPGTKA